MARRLKMEKKAANHVLNMSTGEVHKPGCSRIRKSVIQKKSKQHLLPNLR